MSGDGLRVAGAWLLAAVVTLAGGAPRPAAAAVRAQLVGSGFTGIATIVHDPVLPDTLYVVQLDGLVRAVVNGATQPTPFLDLRAVTSPAGGELGLLGMAFPPDAATSGRVFVNFIDTAGNTVVARFTRTAASPRVAVAASRKDLQWPAPGGGRQGYIVQTGANHKGGHLAFGPDAYLYVGLGDGGGDNDPSQNAQNPASLLGKMLRVNVSVPDSDPIGYMIPPGNPTFPVAGVPAEVWAFGLRNPWRYSFDQFGNGRTRALLLADVGQSDREEVNVEPHGRGGRNYGWRAFEGSTPNPNLPVESPAYTPVTAPTFEYPRSDGGSVIGGFVYRGTALPEAMRGRYVFGDCVSGRIWSLAFALDPVSGEGRLDGRVDHTEELGGPFGCITSFARDGDGELSFTDLDFTTGASRIFRLVDGDTLPPGPPTDLTAAVTGSTVALTWKASLAGGATASYVLEAGSAPTLTNLGVVPLVEPALSVPGIADGTYFIRVRAVGPAGVSGPSNEIQAVVGCTVPPPAPQIATVTVTGRTVTFAWALPPGSTRAQLDVGYAAGSTALVVPIDGTPASLAVPEVPPGTYFARLRAVNACGTSEASAEQTIVVP